MKNYYIKIILMLLLLGCYLSAQGYQSGYDLGRTSGAKLGQNGWLARGLIGSLMFNVVGGFVTVLGAGSEKIVIPDSIIPQGTADYHNGFVQGYKDSIVRERRSSALFGAAFGICVNTVILVLTFRK